MAIISNIKNKIDGIIYPITKAKAVYAKDDKTLETKVGEVNGLVTTYDDIMTTTDSSFAASATAVKEGFDELNSNLKVITGTFKNESTKIPYPEGWACDSTTIISVEYKYNSTNWVPLYVNGTANYFYASKDGIFDALSNRSQFVGVQYRIAIKKN